jgi:hypothetical protein
MSHDLQGRPYAKISEVKAGDVLETDGDFTCMPKGEKVLVRETEKGDLYFYCDELYHGLCGQIKEDYYIGLYKI